MLVWASSRGLVGRGQRLGPHFRERNWRGRRGELDIIAEREGTTVFVEVKTRATFGFGHPFEAITSKKLRALRRLAGEWCALRAPRARIRLDAIAVIGGEHGPARIEHLRGIG